MTDADPPTWHEPLDLMGPQEIREALGISRQRFNQLTDLPTPVAELAIGHVWWGPDIRTYDAGRNKRTGPRPKSAGGEE